MARPPRYSAQQSGSGAWPSVSFPSWRYVIAAGALRVCFPVQSTTIGRRAQRHDTEIGSSRYGRCGSFLIEFCSRLSWIFVRAAADAQAPQFRRVPFARDVAFDPGGATASRIAMPPMLPSTVPSVSASATLLISWLNPPPHPITVYASHPPSPTTAQHSLPGGALPPYRGRSFTGRIASASPDAPELTVRIHSPPAQSPVQTRRLIKDWRQGRAPRPWS